MLILTPSIGYMVNNYSTQGYKTVQIYNLHKNKKKTQDYNSEET